VQKESFKLRIMRSEEIQYSLVELARSDSQRQSQAPDHVYNSNLATIS